jgi:dipeptidyl aminopeptidase/acylaminoacyl peptidase
MRPSYISRPPHRLSLLALVLLLGTIDANGQSRALTPHDVARLRTVMSAEMSPDGRHIAYTLIVPRTPLKDDDGPAWEELHVVGADGTARPFVTGKVNVGVVRWSPDGTRLSFLAKRDGDATRSLYVMPRDGGEASRLFAHETDISSYAWNPDGRTVAFLAQQAQSKEQKELAAKGFSQEIYEESAVPVRVWTIEPGQADAKAKMLDLPGSAASLSWSPTGDRLAVALAPTPLVDDDLMRKRVHVVDARAGTVIRKIENPGKLGQVAWSPDGKHLALVSAADLNDPAEGRLMVAPVDTGVLTDILPNHDAHVRGIAWVDNDTLRYLVDEGVETAIGEVRRDGTAKKTIFPAGGPIVLQFEARPGSRTMAFVAETAQHPGELFLVQGPGERPRRVTDSNPWLSEIRLARQEVVRFKARDGLALEGILIRPLDARQGQRVPLILTVHGGPESHDRNGWKTSYANAGQLAAGRGFAVFYPNYRGSTGRGVAFSKLGQNDAAGKEFDDLVDAVDHLVGIGLVDRAKVGITGGSYGGYASAWGATYHTDRFAASVMFVGISDKISKVGTTDIANEEYLVHARKRPWEAWQFFLERSPIYHASKSKTPILILHGKADPRVNPTQSLELYRHLKLHGKTVRLVWYPGEQHGNRRAASRLDYNLRLMQWMEHYLQGPGGAPPPYELKYPEPAVAVSSR